MNSGEQWMLRIQLVPVHRRFEVAVPGNTASQSECWDDGLLAALIEEERLRGGLFDSPEAEAALLHRIEEEPEPRGLVRPRLRLRGQLAPPALLHALLWQSIPIPPRQVIALEVGLELAGAASDQLWALFLDELAAGGALVKSGFLGLAGVRVGLLRRTAAWASERAVSRLSELSVLNRRNMDARRMVEPSTAASDLALEMLEGPDGGDDLLADAAEVLALSPRSLGSSAPL